MSEPTGTFLAESTPVPQEWLRTVLHLLPVGVVIVDTAGRLLAANAAASALWGQDALARMQLEHFGTFEAYWPGTGRRLRGEEWAVARTLRTRQTVSNEEVDIVGKDGARRTILNSSAPLYSAESGLVGAVNINVDITERKATERAEFFVSEASRLLAESLDWETTLKAVARLATLEWADYCMVDVLGPDGALHRLALSAKDPRKQSLLDQTLPFPPEAGSDTPLGRAFARGKPVLIADITPDWLDQVSRSSEHRQLLEALAPRSSMLLPLAVGRRRFGIINLVSASPARRYTKRELGYATEFARRAALAVESARLYREAREALRERDASAAMLESFFAASPVGMGFVNQDLRYVRLNKVIAENNGIPLEKHLGFTPRELMGPAGGPIEDLLRQVLESEAAVVDDPVEYVAGPEPRTFLATYFPVRSGTDLLGVGGVVREITEQRRMETHLRFLTDATTRLATSLDWRTTVRNVAELVVAQMADYCLVDMLGEDGQHLERVERRARNDRLQAQLEKSMPYAPQPGATTLLRKVLETGRSELVAEVDETAMRAFSVNDVHREVLEGLSPRSVMIVPLMARGRTLGIVSAATCSATRRFSTRDLSQLEDLAWRAALAVDNARLYRQAEQAVAARDEFVAVATHELRTPLSALHLQLSSLQRTVDKLASEESERLGQGLSGALRQADRLTRLVAHLFDVARLGTGQMALELGAVELSSLVHALVARMEEALATAGCVAVVHADQPVVALADRPRVEQVLMNLLTNAMKYAPGLPVELYVERDAEKAIIAVRDWGPGIPPEARERVFERFARNTGEHARASLGLGLYISRQLARAHGGDLLVETPPEGGPGSRFVLHLPRWKKPS
ncbi:MULTISPECIES: sensor histidine kinase [unclassified Corallococcus]|uniref:sensor histidine kinase n=1 Tax=unclassified Corallococcus TaxID=2685029 RepID=UPI001A906A39|nr:MULTISPECIES: PAS domain-containing protein [unclassified Corallococcus]MBN9681025.1 PAS domain-containing protein [Corallococcus sp. NCSPR001]WAS87380.1 PAS domain-containing protein [Corallococcus sp. NCRR]